MGAKDCGDCSFLAFSINSWTWKLLSSVGWHRLTQPCTQAIVDVVFRGLYTCRLMCKAQLLMKMFCWSGQPDLIITTKLPEIWEMAITIFPVLVISQMKAVYSLSFISRALAVLKSSKMEYKKENSCQTNVYHHWLLLLQKILSPEGDQWAAFLFISSKISVKQEIVWNLKER